MPCDCDWEQPEFYVATIRTARKTHRCDECYGLIAIKEKYEHVSAKWDGAITSYKTCARCLSLRSYTTDSIKCVCWSHGSMIEDCIETLKEYSCELPGLLFGGYKLMLRAQKSDKYLGNSV